MGNYDSLIMWANKKRFAFDTSKSDEAIAEDLRQFAKDASSTAKQKARFDPFEAENIVDSFNDAGTKFQRRTLDLRASARDLTIGDLGKFGLTTKSSNKTLEDRFNLPPEEAEEIARRLELEVR